MDDQIPNPPTNLPTHPPVVARRLVEAPVRGVVAMGVHEPEEPLGQIQRLCVFGVFMGDWIGIGGFLLSLLPKPKKRHHKVHLPHLGVPRRAVVVRERVEAKRLPIEVLKALLDHGVCSTQVSTRPSVYNANPNKSPHPIPSTADTPKKNTYIRPVAPRGRPLVGHQPPEAPIPRIPHPVSQELEPVPGQARVLLCLLGRRHSVDGGGVIVGCWLLILLVEEHEAGEEPRLIWGVWLLCLRRYSVESEALGVRPEPFTRTHTHMYIHTYYTKPSLYTYLTALRHDHLVDGSVKHPGQVVVDVEAA